MGEAMEMLERIRGVFRVEAGLGLELDASEIVEGFVSVVGPNMTDDFTCVMDGGMMRTTYEGVEGLRAGWTDFLGAFETLVIEPGEAQEGPDGATVVEFVGLTGKPRGVAGTIEAGAAAVWHVRDGQVSCIEFYMDRPKALQAAGVEP